MNHVNNKRMICLLQLLQREIYRVLTKQMKKTRKEEKQTQLKYQDKVVKIPG